MSFRSPYVSASSRPSGSSSARTAPPSEPLRDLERDEIDVLTDLLLSSEEASNLFTAPPDHIVKLIDSHHIERTPGLTVSSSHQALLTHLLSGACTGTCDPLSDKYHAWSCNKLCNVFPTRHSMIFAALSI